jgi:hypothetical protein
LDKNPNTVYPIPVPHSGTDTPGTGLANPKIFAIPVPKIGWVFTDFGYFG